MIANPDIRMEIINAVDSSVSIRQKLSALLTIWGDSKSHTNMSHIIVLTDRGVIVAGGMLDVSVANVTILRLCTTIERSPDYEWHNRLMIQFLLESYNDMDIHVSAANKRVNFYRDHAFVKKNITNRCECLHTRNFVHLVRIRPPTAQKGTHSI